MSTSEKAAEGGHLHVLKWLRANGCPWDEMACVGTAKGGHLEVLKWLRAKGRALERAVARGRDARGTRRRRGMGERERRAVPARRRELTKRIKLLRIGLTIAPPHSHHPSLGCVLTKASTPARVASPTSHVGVLFKLGCCVSASVRRNGEDETFRAKEFSRE